MIPKLASLDMVSVCAYDDHGFIYEYDNDNKKFITHKYNDLSYFMGYSHMFRG